MDQRKEKALQAASDYAPAPEASALTYGLISIALFSVGIWGAGRFYDVSLSPYSSLLLAGSAIAFCVGIWLRKKRKRRHVDAYESELGRLGGSVGP